MTIWPVAELLSTQAAQRFELFIAYKKVSLHRLFINLFCIVTQVKLLCGQMIIIVAVLNVLNVTTFRSEQIDALEC
jgi:hypothetical protein